MLSANSYYMITLSDGKPLQADLVHPQFDAGRQKEIVELSRRKGAFIAKWEGVTYATEKTILTDWICPMALIPTVSEKVRAVLEAHVGPSDVLEFLPVTVRLGDGGEASYYMLHWPEQADVYDTERTDWGPSGAPMRYWLSREKLAGRNLVGSGLLVAKIVVVPSVLKSLEDADALRGATYWPASNVC